MYINKAILYGNITRDPELKALPSGQSVCNFSVATNRTFKDKAGAKQEDVQYHNVVCYGKTADNIKAFMRKGSAIYIEGRIQTRNWEKDGSKHYMTEIVAEQVQFGPKKAGVSEDSGRESENDRQEEEIGAEIDENEVF